MSKESEINFRKDYLLEDYYISGSNLLIDILIG